MADVYLTLEGEDNQLTEVEGTVVSAGVASGGRLVALDAEGKLDDSIITGSGGTGAIELETTEALAAGDFVNIYDAGGVAKIRLARADTNLIAHGFIKEAAAATELIIVYTQGINIFVTGLIPASTYFLSATVPGGVDTVVPTTAGSVVQRIGKAVAADQLLFDPLQPIVRT